MSVYICNKCNRIFTREEALKRETSWEDEYGAPSEFKGYHELVIDQCPECGCEDDLDWQEFLCRDDFEGDFFTPQDKKNLFD